MNRALQLAGNVEEAAEGIGAASVFYRGIRVGVAADCVDKVLHMR